MVAASRPNNITRPRWADVEDNSEEEPEALLCALDDASYRDDPLATLEDSKSGLNATLAKSRVGPQDFSFMLSGKNEDRRWMPNVSAAEFIPCMPPPVRPAHRTRPRRTPEKENQAPRQDISPRKETGCGRKRRPQIQMQAISKKSSKGDLGAFPRGRLPGPCSETGSSVQSEATEATEQEWEHRLEMRAKAVALSKETAEYQRCEELRNSGKDGAPVTPNYTDRSISKRQWKFQLQQWRLEVQKYVETHAEVTR
ncbi:unnamed protein product [Effrenium voratum]|uniref:Histone RNA hairpin-binding protein RNA-binding domain-containing protein n=1 Tax=Effrenium voratum TaxID=2562239 RepID=A0AA36I275_9DINO|nr:unnamed protein product [Effrenium voratum]CAJ1420305.1 unnamed protein product [Effrenium voratum]